METIKFEENGFMPLVYFKGWRVAVLNFFDMVSKEKFYRVERHMETDEVFVLLKGQAYLIVGDDNEKMLDVRLIKMEECTIYNIKQNVWHHIIMSEDCSVLIVEEADTSLENSEYFEIDQAVKYELVNKIEI